MEFINPHELVGNKRDVWWSDLTCDEPIQLELIDYYKAPVRRKGKGVYVIYYAIARKDYASLGIITGDELIIYISFRSYVTALRKLSSEYKTPAMKKFADGKNLMIEMEKLSTQQVRINWQEVIEPTEEQTKEAERQYGIISRQEEYQTQR